jgi:hypothetical protein
MEDLKKILNDFCEDIKNTFPEYSEVVERYNLDSLTKYCKKYYTDKTLEIVYKNDTIFKKDCYFLPGINFKTIWADDISEQTKETLWKYFQLILFSYVSMDDHSFSDTLKYFEKMDKDDFKEKIDEIMKNLKSDTNFNNSTIPDEEKLNSTFDGLLNTKLGNIAKDIAEETSKKMNLDPNADVMESLLNNPANFMSLINDVSENLTKKMKNGEVNQEELLKESSSILNNMGGDLQSMFSSLGLDKLLQKNNKAKQAVSKTTTRDRLRKKLEDKNKK